MKQNKRAIVLTALLVLLPLMAGCPIKDPYRAAIRGSADVSQAVSSGIKITSSYYSNGTFNDIQKATAAKYFTVVTDCNMAFRKSVVDAHNMGATGAAAYLPIAQSFVSCTRSSQPLSMDPKVQNVLQAVDTAITGIEAAIASAKGTK